MKPANYPDLKVLIQKLDKRHKQRQATRVILAGSAVLGTFILGAPFLMPKNAPVATTSAPTTTEVAAPAPDAYASVSLYGRAAIVYDLTTKEVIYEKHAKTQLPLASLTKLITAYAAASVLTSDASVTVTSSALNEEGESGLQEGEVFTFEDAAKLALVASSNDITEAIAETAATHESTTGKRLLASAVEAIGLPQTYALNGTGLDVNTTLSGGYGSAYDVAQLAGALLEKAPNIAAATTRSSVTVYSKNGAVHTLPNTNQDVVQVPNLLLSKTGFTDLAGGNLAIVYDAGIGHPVAIVVLGSTREGRFADVAKLLSLTGKHFAGMSAVPTAIQSTTRATTTP